VWNDSAIGILAVGSCPRDMNCVILGPQMCDPMLYTARVTVLASWHFGRRCYSTSILGSAKSSSTTKNRRNTVQEIIRYSMPICLRFILSMKPRVRTLVAVLFWRSSAALQLTAPSDYVKRRVFLKINIWRGDTGNGLQRVTKEGRTRTLRTMRGWFFRPVL
jgi:hypothetical protein